jgi:hypothetical protein
MEPDLNDSRVYMLWMERQGFIIRTRHNTVLVDTRGGENKQRTNPGFHKLASPWVGNFCAPGLAPEQIDVVACIRLTGDRSIV